MLLQWMLLTIFCVNLNLAQEAFVTIPNGVIKGRTEFSMRRTGVPFYAFQQIPYGKPPVGDLRFKEPQPADPWTGTLDATKNEKVCYQVANGFNIQNLTSVETEDCLFLNVYTPKYPSLDRALPVMFWIYGGGFICGASNFDQSGPHYLMENDVIVVTASYRVGPFGFLATGDLEMPGNYGLKDQNLALQWVKNNIQYFGGDPNRVTIFGTSAGAASVTYQYMSKKSDGLFWAGIAGSGSLLCPWTYQKDHRDIAYKLAKTIDSNFNTQATTKELVEFLRSVSADQLNDASSKAIWDTVGNEELVQGFFYAPVIEPEHENAFITEKMYDVVESGRMNRVPLMIGIESEEALTRSSDEWFKSNLKIYDANVSLLVNNNMHITDSSTLNTVGEKIRDIYTDGLLQDNFAKSIRLFSDMSFNRPIIHHAQLQSQFSDVYFYQFSYDGKLGGNKVIVDGADKVQHSEDGNYIWAYGNWSVLDTYPESDQLTSERWRTLFTNFAKYQNPTPDQSSLLQNIIWPKFEPGNFQYLNVNNSLSIERDPKNTTVPQWIQLYYDNVLKPYITF